MTACMTIKAVIETWEALVDVVEDAVVWGEAEAPTEEVGVENQAGEDMAIAIVIYRLQHPRKVATEEGRQNCPPEDLIHNILIWDPLQPRRRHPGDDMMTTAVLNRRREATRGIGEEPLIHHCPSELLLLALMLPLRQTLCLRRIHHHDRSQHRPQ